MATEILLSAATAMPKDDVIPEGHGNERILGVKLWEIERGNLLWVVGDSTINEIPRNFGLCLAWLIALNHTKLET
jgi:hypothetical protein